MTWTFPRTEHQLVAKRHRHGPIAKAPPPPQTPLWRVVNLAYRAGERDIRREVLEALQDMFDSASLGRLEQAFLTGNIDMVLRTVRIPEIMAKLAERLDPVALRSLNTAADHLTREILATGDVPAGVLGETFGDIWTKETARFAGLWSSRLVREVGANTEKAIRDLTLRAYQEGLGTRAASRQIRSIVGLTQRQAHAVASFRQGLIDAIEGGQGIEVLESRFSLSRDVLRNNRQLTLANVDRLTEAYRTRWVTHRAGVIARTESVRIYNSGRLLAMKRVQAQTGVKGLKRWLTTPDERACFPAGHKVLTEGGWIKIEDVKVGDYVLTHQNRMRMVLATNSFPYTGRFVVVGLPNGFPDVHMTFDHKVLTHRSWVEAGEIHWTDYLWVTGAKCGECGGVAPSLLKDSDVESCLLTTVKADKVKQYEVQKEMVYDLQVEEDESFVVGGLVVHNCEICLPMNDQTVPLDDVFEMGTGGTISQPPAHVSCRCSVAFISPRKAAKPRSRAEQRAADRLEEIGAEREAAREAREAEALGL